MKNLKKLRNEKKISQQNLADIFHISQQAIYKYENDLSEPDITTLKALADYFEVSLDYLLDHTDNPVRNDLLIDTRFSNHEIILLEKYRQLPYSMQESIESIINDYLSLQK